MITIHWLPNRPADSWPVLAGYCHCRLGHLGQLAAWRVWGLFNATNCDGLQAQTAGLLSAGEHWKARCFFRLVSLRHTLLSVCTLRSANIHWKAFWRRAIFFEASSRWRDNQLKKRKCGLHWTSGRWKRNNVASAKNLKKRSARGPNEEDHKESLLKINGIH